MQPALVYYLSLRNYSLTHSLSWDLGDEYSNSEKF